MMQHETWCHISCLGPICQYHIQFVVVEIADSASDTSASGAEAKTAQHLRTNSQSGLRVILKVFWCSGWGAYQSKESRSLGQKAG